MAGYGRYRYSGSRYSRRRYGYSRSRSSRRRALGNARSARAQRDNATVVINRIASFPITVTGSSSGSGSTTVYSGSTTINHWNQLRLSQYFPNYSPMYDQVKIDKIRVKITGSQAGSAVTSNISPAIIAAFDRNGLDVAQNLTSAAISTYSSAQLKQWSTGNSFVMYQTIYPSSIMEKGQYIPTNSLQDPTSVTATTNPCVNQSDPTLPFKPITLLAVDMGGVTAAADQVFSFTVELEYTVTFRGMRKPTLGYSDDAEPLDIVVQNSDIADSPLIYSDGPYSTVTVDLSEITTEPSYNITTLSRTVTQNSPTTPLVEDAPAGTLWNRVELLVNVPTPTQSFILRGMLLDARKPSTFAPFSQFVYTRNGLTIDIPPYGAVMRISTKSINNDPTNETNLAYQPAVTRNNTADTVTQQINGIYWYYPTPIVDPDGSVDSNYWIAADENTPIVEGNPYIAMEAIVDLPPTTYP
nr:MAG: putative capsid protein [Canine stool-associated circular virus]